MTPFRGFSMLIKEVGQVFPLAEVLFRIIGEMVELLANPLVNPFFWIVVVIIAFQYKRMSKTKEALFGVRGEPYLKYTLQATLFGLLGGFLGSFLMVLVGITVTGIGLSYIWPIAILLMLVSPHYLCFAYAGGLLSLSYLFLGIPRVNVPQVMGLVAILHLIESILILTGGHLGAMPVFAKNARGRLVGGFTLQKFWPIPIVLLSLPGTTPVQMPQWWPPIDFNVDGLTTHFLPPLIGVAAGLGYGDIALARTPREKSKISALHLSIYSLILLVLALLSARQPLFAYLAAFFSPLGHEAVIKAGQKSELEGKPIYVPPAQGVLVLDVQAKSPAAQVGIVSGDIVYAINGETVRDRLDLDRLLWDVSGVVEIEFLHGKAYRLRRRIIRLGRGETLGIISAPEGYEGNYVEFTDKGFLYRLWQKAKK